MINVWSDIIRSPKSKFTVKYFVFEDKYRGIFLENLMSDRCQRLAHADLIPDIDRNRGQGT